MFDSMFRFNERLKSMEASFSEYRQTNPFAEAVSNIPVRVAIQIQTDRLHDSYQRENDEFLKTIDDNMKRIIKEQVKIQIKDQVSRILPRIEQSVNAQLEFEVLTRSSHSSRTSYAVAADLSEMELKKILIEKMEGNKSIQRSNEQQNLYKAFVDAYKVDKTILESYRDTAILKRRRRDDDDQEGPSAGSNRGSKRQREGREPEPASTPSEPTTRSASRSTTGTQSRQMLASESVFTEEPVKTTCQMDEPSHPVFETGAEYQPIVQTSQHHEWFSQPRKPPTPDQTPIDFSNFIMNWLCVDTLTPELLAGPTYELMRGSCNSLTELEYHLEEVYKATTDQLDWVNPEGQQYPHNLLQPLPLIPDNRGRRVILFAHFINNNLEYLRGGASSRKYTTSMTKTKAADYGHIKWIEDLVPRTMWIQEPLNYDKHALWGVSHWGQKRQQFYGFAVNWESALDVYSKRRIIAVTDLKIGKLSNLTVEERFAFNVSLRMFTRSIVIQRRVKYLQLGVKSYQKRLNLTKPDTYRSDLKRHEAYTAYSNPRGFIYQNKDKKNRLMQINELHKFSDGMLNDVRNALDDRIKGIRMQYLPQTIWRKGDKDRAAAMIQAIDKMLKTRRIMRSLEWFVGGRLKLKKRRWRYLVPAESHIHNHMLIPDYEDNKYQDFRYSDELSKSRKHLSGLICPFLLLCICEITNPSHLHTDDIVADLLTKAFDGPRVFNSPMLHLLRIEMVINSPWIMPILGTKELASPEQTAPDFSSILVKTQSLRYVVLTGRVVVPTGRYVVPAGTVIIVSSGRLSLIPTSRVLSPGRIQIVILG
nr:hypothetical protein [Tanacetum cinerariifolium]